MSSNVIISVIVILISWWSWCLWRQMIWTPALPWRIKRKQTHIIDYLPSRRRPVIADARRWLADILRMINTRIEREQGNAGTAADVEAQQEIADEAAGMPGFSAMVAPIDILAQWLLCVATMPQFTTLTNLAFGIGIGAGIWVGTFYFFTLWDRRSTPRRSVRVAKSWAMVAFGVAATGGLIYLAARYAAPAFFVGREDIVLASLVALAELLPVAGGAASFGAGVAHRQATTTDTIASLNEQKAMLDAFSSWLDDHEISDSTPSDDQPAAPRLVEEVPNA